MHPLGLSSDYMLFASLNPLEIVYDSVSYVLTYLMSKNFHEDIVVMICGNFIHKIWTVWHTINHNMINVVLDMVVQHSCLWSHDLT